MTVSDYIVDFFCKKAINHFFGYQGTMIAYFVDAIHRNPNAFNHSCYNEQGASFAACGYAQALGKCGVAYSTLWSDFKEFQRISKNNVTRN